MDSTLLLTNCIFINFRCRNEVYYSTSKVYLLVTNLEHDVIKIRNEVENSTMLRSASGELGCWVDPVSTRITQTGVEHHRVVDIDLEISDFEFTRLKTSQGFIKFYDLASSCLGENASIMGLCPFVLLKGPTGSAMSGLVRIVARCLGYHFLDVREIVYY